MKIGEKIFLLFLTSTLFFFQSCSDETDTKATLLEYHSFSSIEDFKQTLFAIAGLPDDTEREIRLEALLDSMVSNNQVPFAINDSVIFIYQGNASQVKWVGDFNGWNANAGYSGIQVSGTNVWIAEKSFPPDARLDYKIVVNNSTWILDPLNRFIQYSGFGPNSELRMPAWQYPQETIRNAAVLGGNVSDNYRISSEYLGYDVQYKIYTPKLYANLTNLPVIYVTDGHEYADAQLGSMVITLDNLIAQSVIPPVIAVFIDPRNPDNIGSNRRMTEYTGNLNFANFIAEELVTEIDANYKTSANPSDRIILGTSLGGLNSAFIALEKPSVFGNIAMHSPALWYNNQSVLNRYNNTDNVSSLKFYISTGTINDTEEEASELKSILVAKEIDHYYIAVNEGHSWGNWRARIKDVLVYFLVE
ncbi:MAG: alpha/beta hydrolase-fold protein [Cyclobacteriaceae bacterium]|nr:alpha/beta hydrolase-fold protein [Cyclobacteriaceae bacterium]